MLSSLRKRLEDGLDAVEAMAAGTAPGSPRQGRHDSVSSFTDASSVTSAPGRSSMEPTSPQIQHPQSPNYVPYQPRAAVSRRTTGISLEERLRANFTTGGSPGSPSPARQPVSGRILPAHMAIESTILPEPTNVSLPPSLPSSPVEALPALPVLPTDRAVDPTSVILPMSPPASYPGLSSTQERSAEPHDRVVSISAPTLNSPSTLPLDFDNDISASASESQPKPTPLVPPNVVVDVSAPQSALATPSDFATAESRSDITDGTPNASVDHFDTDVLHSPAFSEVPNTPSGAAGGLSHGSALASEPAVTDNVSGVEHRDDEAPTEKISEGENDSETKLRDRLKVVELRFADISTSFKRLQAERAAADKLIKEVSSLEGLFDLDALRDYMMNQKMKVEISNEEIKRLSAQIRQRDERLEEVREMHKMESSSQSDLVEKLRQQLTESEALLKVVESDSSAQKTGLSQHEVEIQRLKGLLKDEEEKRAKAITLLKTVRQKLTKAEKERDDVAKERDKDREDTSTARSEVERIRADAERAKNERERDIAAMRDRFEKEVKETRERYEKELAARKGQYELDVITIKAAHAKELSTKTARIATLESTVASLTTEKENLFEQSQTRQAEAESAQSHLLTVQNQVSELEYQLREAESRNSVLVDELDELRNSSRLSMQSPTPNPEIARLLSEAEGKFEGQLSEMRMKLRAAEKERNEAEDDWNKTLADRGKEIERLRFSLRQAEDKWLESGRVGKGMDEKVATLEHNVRELHTERATWNAERLAMSENLKKTQDDLSVLQSEHEDALGRISSFETQLEESKARENYLKTSSKTLRDELRKVQSSAALLERQRPGGVGFWAGTSSSTPTKGGNGTTSPVQSPRAGSPTVSEVGSTSARQEEEVNLEYIRNVILQFLEHKEMRPNLVRVLSTILRFTPQETRRLVAKV